MGFRFRKSVKLMPGVRVSFGKRGASVSVGGRGGRLTFGPNGTRASVGIPGSGISYSARVDGTYWQRKTERERRRAEREAERLERAQQRLAEAERRAEALSQCKVALKDDGRVEFENAFGEPLTGADLRLAWERQGDAISRWLEENAAEINEETERLTRIHEDTPDPAEEPAYARENFDEPKPQPRPSLPAPFLAAEPEPPLLREPGFLHRLLPWWLGRRLERENAAALRQHEEAVAAWRRRRDAHWAEVDRMHAEWSRAMEAWDGRRKAHEGKQTRLEAEWRHGLATSVEAMEDALGEAMGMVEWPLDTEVDFAVEDGGATVWLDVDLPEMEDIPDRVAAVAANRKRLNIRQKPQGQMREEYAGHVHGIAFRLAGIAFASLPACRTAAISGYSQRPDKATGRILDDYLISVVIDRDRFSEVDFTALDRVDPVEALDRFEPRRKMSKSLTFKAIEPMVQPVPSSAPRSPTRGLEHRRQFNSV